VIAHGLSKITDFHFENMVATTMFKYANFEYLAKFETGENGLFGFSCSKYLILYLALNSNRLWACICQLFAELCCIVLPVVWPIHVTCSTCVANDTQFGEYSLQTHIFLINYRHVLYKFAMLSYLCELLNYAF